VRAFDTCRNREHKRQNLHGSETDRNQARQRAHPLNSISACLGCAHAGFSMDRSGMKGTQIQNRNAACPPA
jgi:hypothetical protein